MRDDDTLTPLKFNANLHGLRGIAAIAVVLFHWGSDIGFYPQARPWMKFELAGSQWDLGMLLDFGWLGVPLFFILSGYLLTTQLHARQFSGTLLRRFWFRRGLRIYPAFWLQLAILLLIAQLLAFMPQMKTTPDLIRHLFLWINLPPAMTAPINSVWWTLPIELSFYLLLPALVLLARYIGWRTVLAASLVITLSWRYGVMHHYEGSNYSAHLPVLDAIPGTLFTFCSGFGLAYFLAGRPPLTSRSCYLLLIAAAVAFYAMLYWLRQNLGTYWIGHWMLGVWNPMMAIVIAAFVCALLHSLNGIAWLGSKPMVWLGEVSYGIYLWHYPILIILHRTVLKDWTTPTLAVPALLITLGATFSAAAISFYCLERPLMRRR